jgi:hypothetical protein
MSSIVLIAIVAAVIYGASKLFFPSPDRGAATQELRDANAQADAMAAKWRRDYVGNVYEGDTGRGAPERIAIVDVKLGQEGPIVSVAFNPRMVDGKLAYGAVYNYSLASFGRQFGTWPQVQLEAGER